MSCFACLAKHGPLPALRGKHGTGRVFHDHAGGAAGAPGVGGDAAVRTLDGLDAAGGVVAEGRNLAIGGGQAGDFSEGIVGETCGGLAGEVDTLELAGGGVAGDLGVGAVWIRDLIYMPAGVVCE